MIYIDHGDLKHGFAIGKSQRLQDWEFRKDEREFARLCNRLRCAKWHREVKAEGGARWARALASYRRSAERRRAKVSAEKRARWEASIKVGACDRCETSFPIEFRGGQRRKFCSPRCAAVSWQAANRERLTAKQRERRRAETQEARPPVVCEHCGRTSPPSIRPRKFCSRACTKANYRRRYATEINERQKAKYHEKRASEAA